MSRTKVVHVPFPIIPKISLGRRYELRADQLAKADVHGRLSPLFAFLHGLNPNLRVGVGSGVDGVGTVGGGEGVDKYGRVRRVHVRAGNWRPVEGHGSHLPRKETRSLAGKRVAARTKRTLRNKKGCTIVGCATAIMVDAQETGGRLGLRREALKMMVGTKCEYEWSKFRPVQVPSPLTLSPASPEEEGHALVTVSQSGTLCALEALDFHFALEARKSTISVWFLRT